MAQFKNPEFPEESSVCRSSILIGMLLGVIAIQILFCMVCELPNSGNIFTLMYIVSSYILTNHFNCENGPEGLGEQRRERILILSWSLYNAIFVILHLLG